jgi:hypothetical protein
MMLTADWYARESACSCANKSSFNSPFIFSFGFFSFGFSFAFFVLGSRENPFLFPSSKRAKERRKKERKRKKKKEKREKKMKTKKENKK